MYISLLMLAPVLIGLVAMLTSRGKITIKEFLCMEVAMLVVMGAGFAIARCSATEDTEIWSGRITGRSQETVPCSHSYECNCITSCSGSGSNQTCSTTCSTCWEHSNDYDWLLSTDTGSAIVIDRVDRQGVDMPARWASAYVHEPVAIAHSFTNYIKANPKTVLTRFGTPNPENLPVPDNPVDVYDYYRVNRFLAVNYAEPKAHEWNWLLNELNGDWGPNKQVNVIVVAVKTRDTNYSYLLEEKWLGGKKNDLIVVLGVPEYPAISWVKILSWSKSETLKVNLRDAILDIGDMQQRDSIIRAIETQIKTKWERRHMKDFEYLMAGAQPGSTGTFILFFIGIAGTIVLAVFFWQNDVFNDESPYYKHYEQNHYHFPPRRRSLSRFRSILRSRVL